MASRVFNKFKEPKSTEFSKKDLVIDIKGGHLFYKSNLGVHKLVGDTIGTSIIESGDVWVDFGSYISYTPNTLTSKSANWLINNSSLLSSIKKFNL